MQGMCFECRLMLGSTEYLITFSTLAIYNNFNWSLTFNRNCLILISLADKSS